MTLSSKKCPTQLKLDRKKCLRVLGRVQTLSEPNVSNHENSGMNTSTLIQRTSLTTISGLKILEAVSKETRTRDLNGGLTLISLLGKFFFIDGEDRENINIVNMNMIFLGWMSQTQNQKTCTNVQRSCSTTRNLPQTTGRVRCKRQKAKNGNDSKAAWAQHVARNHGRSILIILRKF